MANTNERMKKACTIPKLYLISASGYLMILLISFQTLGQKKVDDIAQLNAMNEAFVSALKAKKDTDLQKFCDRLVTRSRTLDYMKSNYLCYRNVPCKMENPEADRQQMIDRYYNRLLRLKNRLKEARLLSKLTYVNNSDFKHEVIVLVHFKPEGINRPTRQMDYSLPSEEFDKKVLLLKAEGKTLEETLLRGKPGKIYLVKGTEMPLQLKSKSTLIHYSIGELVCINGEWSLFTEPNVDYHILNQ